MENLLFKALAIALVGTVSMGTVNPDKAYAKRQCFTQYGGGETCVDVKEDADLKVDKSVYNPTSKDYEDNVKAKGGSYPYIFSKTENIKFRIKVENTGDVRINDINLEDILPSYIKYAGGDGDDKDDGRKVEFDIGDLKSGESEEVEFTAKYDANGVDPKDSYICLTNIAKAKGERADDEDDDESALDYSNFCVGIGKVLGKETPKVLPVTGSKDVLIISTAVGLVLIGFGIRKLAE